MTALFIVIVSIALQLVAAFQALRLIRITGKSVAWGLIAAAIVLMALRRGISLVEALTSVPAIPLNTQAELVALAISALMVAGIGRIAPVFLELRTVNDKLRESEELFRAIFDQSPVAIELIDPDTLQFVGVNPVGCDLLGYTREEILRLRLTDTQTGMDEAALTEAVRQVAASGSVTFENRHRCKNGDILDVEVNTRVVGFSGRRLLVGIWRDITEKKRAENTARQFGQLLQNSFNEIFVFDADSMRFLQASKGALENLGYSADELMQLTALDIKPLFMRENYEALIAPLRRGERQSMVFETLHQRKDGTTYPVETRLQLMGGVPPMFLAIVQDITEYKQAEENLRITASVFENSQDAVVITNADNIITDVNPAFTRITGYSREEVIGKNPRLLSSGRQGKDFYADMWQTIEKKRFWRGEIWNRRKSGEIYAEQLSISAICCDDDGKVLRYVAVFSDISHIKEHEAELNRVAYYDALTGIPNRVLLADRMKLAIAQTAREGSMMAVGYLDLDGFKPINDLFGHEAGDQVLIELAKRIGSTIRGGDTVARLGGDEFVVLLLGLERGEECVATLERLLAAIAQPITVKGRIQTLSASIGVSIYPLDEEDPDTLLRHADQAMYIAKQSGKNRFHIYDPALDQRAREQHDFLKSIRYGLERNQFELHYQPKVNLRTKQLSGAEALIRWRHPQRGLRMPAEFLRFVENTELDIEIGEWVIGTALEQIDRWHRAGLDIEVSINISAYHLESSGFMERLRQQIARYPDMPPYRLQVEVLETVALNDIVIVRGIIESCRKLGVSFALDDFGTGYSSLSYLSGLPVDVLKIDQSFVRNMPEDKGATAIVQGIIALARVFGRKTVAEGIETEGQYKLLLDMGCEAGQGYGIARPMPADDMQNWQATFHF